MARSISIVDYKTQQAEFFLRRLSDPSAQFFEVQCYTDAFVTSTRSITFALQSVCTSIPKFSEWYSQQQTQMKNDALMRFFHDYRTASNHIGDTPTRAGRTSRDANGRVVFLYFFLPTLDLPNPPTSDVASTCKEYFVRTLRVVYDCYRCFSHDLDDRWHFTADHFESLGRTIEDAEEAMGFPRGWTAVGESSQEQLATRWSLLRRHHCVGCQINELFTEYLSETIEGPDYAAP